MILEDLGLRLQVMDEVARAARVDVVAAEVDLWEAIALFLREFIPVCAALYVEDDLITEVGAADAQRDDDIDIVFDMVRQFLQVLQRARAVEMPLLYIRQLGEQDFLRFAILREMRTDEARLAHDLHRLMRLLEVFLVGFEVRFRDFAFTVKVVVVERKTGFQL